MRDAALDASCDLKYYASDHFASQAGLQLQGELQKDTKVRTFNPNPTPNPNPNPSPNPNDNPNPNPNP